METQDISREWFTAEKWLHFLRVLFSRKATEVLDAYQRFEDIDFERLSILWKHWIILDIDECVAPHHGDILPENLAKIKELLEWWWKIVIFSNMKKSGRYRELEGLWVQVITSKYAKPDARWFEECGEKLWLSKEEVVMIGDNYLTDGGCKNAGIDFIKIKPIVTEDGASWIRRKLQIKFRSLIDSRAKNAHGTLNYK